MKVRKKQIGDIFPYKKLLEIPIYQRTYIWGPEEWGRLLKDLKYMCERKEEYFLGSVILKDSVIQAPDNKYFSGKSIIVDGQQRLTTLLVMMKVIALINNDEITFKAFFITENRRKRFEAPSLRLSLQDRPDFERILTLEKLEEVNGTSRVVDAYNYFRTHIDKGLAETMNLGLMTDKMIFATITVDEAENGQQLFETVNSLGVRLARVAEKLRSADNHEASLAR